MKTKLSSRAFAALFSTILMAAAAHGQQMIYVNQASSNTSQLGLSWDTAYRELRDAMVDSRVYSATAANPTEIWIASGNYKPTSGTDRSKSFVLQSHLRLRGGFAGTETKADDRSFYGSIAFVPTVLTGDIATLQTNGVTTNTPLGSLAGLTFSSLDPGLTNNSENVLLGTNVTDVVLDGLIVTGGYANLTGYDGSDSGGTTNVVTAIDIGQMTDPAPSSELGDTITPLDHRIAGGGLAFVNAPGWFENANPNLSAIDLEVDNCIFIDNFAQGFGGGMAVREAHAEVNNSEFLDNFSDYEGGAFWGQNQLAYFQSCYFLNNFALRSGGAVHLESIPSLRTLNPMFSESDFMADFGTTKANALTTAQTYQGKVDLSIDAMLGTLISSNFITPAMLPKPDYERLGKDSGSLAFSIAVVIAKQTTLGPSIKAFVQWALGATGAKLLTYYSGVSTAVTAVDFGFEIASLFPGELTSPSYQHALANWNKFYINFSTYATPAGWLGIWYSLYEESMQPTYEQAAGQLRDQASGYYNMMPSTLFLFCDFETNMTAGTGGGLMDIYDNVQIETSRFDGNNAVANAGAAAFMSYTFPTLVSDAFLNNRSHFGNSAIVDAFSVQPRILNCTIMNNGSANANGFALDNETGADCVVGNSILWGNTNAAANFATGGADLFTEVKSGLDSNSLTCYNQAGNSHWDWIGICDVHYSCIQSLLTTPLGQGDIYIPSGSTAQEIVDYHNDEVQADRLATLNLTGLFNVGEGTRETLTNPNYGNINRNPAISSDGVTPSPGSPVLNAGLINLVQNQGTNPVIEDYFDFSITGYDLFFNPRTSGSQISMGAVENGSSSEIGSSASPNPFAGLPTSNQGSGDTNFSGGNYSYTPPFIPPPPPSPVTNLYVNANVSGGNGSGTNWANATTQIPAITNLATNGVLWIAAGTYHPSQTVLSAGMSIYGGFQGGETNVSQSNPKQHPTILSGGGTTSELLVIVGGNGQSVVQGLIFTGSAGTNGAGGLEIVTNALVQNCQFTNNVGSAAIGYSAGVIFSNCQFLGNAGGPEPVLYLDNGSALSCLFSNNTGLAVFGPYSSLANCQFVGNSLNAFSEFSALEMFSGAASNCLFATNVGPALYMAGGTVLQSCQFIGHSETVVYCTASILSGCQFTANSAGQPSEAVVVMNGGTARNCVFTSNTGVVGIAYTPALLTNCQFFGNSAGASSPLLTLNGAVAQSCLFSNNLGAIGAAYASGAFTNCQLFGNSPGASSSPLLYLNGAIAQSCLFSNNIGLPLNSFVSSAVGCQFVHNATNASSSSCAMQASAGTVINCQFLTNGGPVLLTQNGTIVQGCLFQGNPGTSVFGSPQVNFTNCQFIANTVGPTPNPVLSLTGGLVQGCVFSNNVGLPVRASVYSSLNGCLFIANTTNGFSSVSALVIDGGSVLKSVFATNFGPAVSASVAQNVGMEFQGCSFLGNTNGTALSSSGSYFVLSNCRFDKNSSPTNAGALSLQEGGGSAIIYGSEFYRNAGGAGSGAIYVNAGSLQLYNCTIYSNTLSAASSPGGAGVRFDSTGFGTVVNTILYGNILSASPGVPEENQQFLGGSFSGSQLNPLSYFVLESCLVQGLTHLGQPFSAVNSFDADPAFANPAFGNLQLLANSPAIVYGTNDVPASLVTSNDLAGNPRMTGGTLDIGAYQFQGTPANHIAVSLALQETCDGLPSFAITAAFSNTPSTGIFQWQVNQSDGNGFVTVTNGGSVSGLNTTTLQITHPPASLSGYQYRIVSQSSTNQFLSTSVTLPKLNSILYVNQNVPGGTGDGSSWDNAMTDLQTAFANAAYCSQIWVAQGTYTPSGVLGPVGFAPQSDVQVYGGFTGVETSVSQRDWQANPVILQASATPVITINSPGVNSGGGFDGFYIQYSGAQSAVVVFAGGPTLRNCIFSNCPTTVVFDQATNQMVFDHCQFYNGSNTVIYSVHGHPNFEHCVFVGNISSGLAGVCQNEQGGFVQFSDCQFMTNSGATSGVLDNDTLGSATILRCAFLGNSGGTAGAVRTGQNSSTTMDSSLLAGNYSKYHGGAINHGGRYLSIAFSTIADNSSASDGGGLYLTGVGWTLQSSIFWGNKNGPTTEAAQLDNHSSESFLHNVYNSIVQGSQGDNNMTPNLPVSPLFVNEAGGDFHLTSHSPAINLGTNAVGTYAVDVLDLDGNTRPAPYSSRSNDIGCFEYQGGTPSYSIALVSVPSTLSICPLYPTNFSMVSLPGIQHTYSWQEFDGVNFTNISSSSQQMITSSNGPGNYTNMLSFPNPGNFDGAIFRVVVDGGNYTTPPFQLNAPQPTTIYVNAAAAPGGDGTTWATAFQSLADGLAAVVSCDQIWVARGDYTADLLANGLPPMLGSGVELFGGFMGTETNVAQRDFVDNVTRIVPGSASNLMTAGFGYPADQTALLDGFHLSSSAGTALAIQNAQPTIQNCTFESNYDAFGADFTSGLAFSNCTFVYTTNEVASIFTGTNVQMLNCYFTSNGMSTNDVLVLGSQVSNIVFQGCAFNANTGALIEFGYVVNGQLVQCSFASNSLSSESAGLNVQASSVGVTNCQFINNTGGTCLSGNGGALVIERCLFTNNVAPFDSVASFINGSLIMRDSLVAANQATGRGIMDIQSSTVTMLNDTVADNQGNSGSAGLNAVGDSLTVRNCIFWGNTDFVPTLPAEQYQVTINGGQRDFSYSIIQGLNNFQSPAGNNLPYDPLFANESAGNYQLTESSPALGAGSSNGLSNGDTDLLGNPLQLEHRVDLGAYVFLGSPFSVEDLNLNFSSRTVCSGGTTSFAVSNASPTASNVVAWLVNTGSGFEMINDDSHYTITTLTNSTATNRLLGSILTISSADSSLNGASYKFYLDSYYTSSTVTLTVGPKSVVYVDAAASGAQDGTSWASAYTNLAGALNGGGVCTAVWMAAGVYPQSQTLVIPPSLEIDGGFPSGGTLADRDPVAYPTLIQAVGSLRTILELETAEAEGQDSTLDGLHFHGGSIAVNCSAGSPVARNCLFEGSTDVAFSCNAATPYFTNCVFSNNAVGLSGEESTIQLSHCVFNHNGGGAQCYYGQFTAADCQFLGNTNADEGGALNLFASGGVVERCVFSGNAATEGGAIYLDGQSALTMSNSLLCANTATFEGGAVFAASTVTAVNCTLADNLSGLYGGAFALYGGSNLLDNCIVWNNSTYSRYAGTPQGEIYLQGGSISAQRAIIQYTTNIAGQFIIIADPLFSNAMAGNFTLSPRSPAIDAGANSYVQPGDTDLAGNARLQNGNVDLGALESPLAANPVFLASQPQSATVCIGQPGVFQVSGAEPEGYFQWQYSLGGNWTNLQDGSSIDGSTVSIILSGNPNITSSTLTISNVGTNLNGLMVSASLLTYSYTTTVATVTVPTNNIIFVDASMPAGGDGTTWATAYTSLLDAIDAYGPCRSIIWVAQGAYAPVATHQGPVGNYNYYLVPGPYENFNYFFIPGGAVIYGGFPTGGGSMASRDWQKYPSILTAPSITNGSVMSMNGQFGSVSNGTILDGLTIQGGPGLTGLSVNNANPIVRNVNIAGCGNSGLLLANAGGTVQNCSFFNNSASDGGGAAIVASSTLFSNCSFLGNTALDSGGGVDLANSSNVFINCSFQGNTALNSGGGIYTQEGNPQFLDVLITGNRALNGGGIYSFGPATMINGTVAGNYATVNGAGFMQVHQAFSIFNSIVWGNRCDTAPQQTLESQQVFSEGSGSFNLQNTTLYGLATLSGPSLVGQDPIFVSALDAGEAPSTNGNFQLAACSPAINSGNPADDAAISLDLAGQPRLTGGQVDLGAYQSTPASATPLLITQQPLGFTFQSSVNTNQFTVAATGDGLTYQWQVAAPGNPFAPVPASAAYSGISTATLTVNQATPPLSGSLFRCVVTSSEGCAAISGEAQLIVLPNLYFVNAAQPNDSGDGYSWSTAFKTLGHALASPSDPSGTQIWLAAGTYKGTDGQTTNVQVGDFVGQTEIHVLRTGDLVYGGFNGTETNISQRNWLTNITIVEPAATNAYVPGNGSNPYGLVIFNLDEIFVPQPDGTVDDVTITLGRIDGCQLRNANTAILSYGGTGLTVANCTFTNCDTGIAQFPPEQGMILAPVTEALQMEISNCLFENISLAVEFMAPDYNPNINLSSHQTIENSIFDDCGAGVDVINGGSVIIAGSSFTGNGLAVSSGADPGISGNQNIPTLTVTNDQFNSNYQALLLNSGYLTLQRSSFRGNGTTNFLAADVSVGIWGGALNLSGEDSYSTAEVEDCLFSGNASYVGGSAVVANKVSEPVFRNCTFSGNRGSTIYDLHNNASSLYNCILWGNSDTGSTAVNPGFVSPIDPATSPNASGDFHLTPCSTLIGTGATNQVGASTTDLDGQPRLFAGTVTPGAYEPASASLVFSSQPSNAVAIQNQTVQFNAAAGATNGVSYNWQVSVGGGAFSNLANTSPYSGVLTAQLAFSAGVAENGNVYRLRAAYSSGCSIYSQPASFSLYNNAVSLTGAPVNGILDLPATNYGFSMSGGLSPASISDQSVAVYAMESGRISFSNGVLNPTHPLHPGEQVFVSVNSSLQSANGIPASPTIFEFINDVTSWDGAFNEAQTIALPGNPTANLLQAGDLNGDGSIDLFVSTTTGCRILTNDGAGHFSDAGQVLGSDAASKIILGNVRGHGLLDAVLLRDGNIEVWTNSDKGVLTLAASYSAATPVTDIALGLLKNDGLMDLFVLTTNDNEIWWNQGAGGFADSGIHLAATNSIGVALGDFNEDGTIDAYVVHSDATPGQLWLNKGGTFVAGAGAGLPSVPSGYQRLIATEVVGDGHLDLVAVANGHAQIWKGQGNGSFSPSVNIAANSPQAVSVGDLNGDRTQDLIIATGGGALTPYIGAGGGFQTLAHQSAFANASATTLADLNGDGALDLALISPAGQVEFAFYQPVELYGNENMLPPGNTAAELPIFFASLQDQFARYSGFGGLSYMIVDSVPTNGYLFVGSFIVVPGEIISFDQFFYPNGLDYLGNPGSSGLDSFTWQGWPGLDSGPPAPEVFQFNISIAPYVSVSAQNDYASVNQGGSVSVLTGGASSVLANDQDSGGGTLVASLNVFPAHGSIQLNADGTFSYTQDGSEAHADSFVYTATDPSSGHSANATVYITINNVNHTPNSISLAQSPIYEGQPAGLLVGQLSATDLDPSVTGFSFSLVSGPGGADNASFSISNNSIITAASLSYAAGATRSILVQVTDLADVYDAGGATYQQAFTINLLPLPVANAQSVQTPENGPALAVTLTGSGLTPLKYSIATPPTNGILTGQPPNMLYQPNANFFGTDSFGYVATDGVMTSAVATVSITVNFVDQAPVVSNLSFTTPPNGPLSLTLTATPFLAGETLSYQINTSDYLGGTLTGTPPNLTYTPAPYNWGIVDFSYTASEGGLTSAVAYVYINNGSQPPIAAARTNQVPENKSTTMYLLGNAHQNVPISFRIVTQPTNGALTGVTQGIFESTDQLPVTYTPNTDFSGVDSFTFVVNDGQRDSAPATITLNVTPIPTSVAVSQTVFTSQGQPANIFLSVTNLAAAYTNAPVFFEVVTQPTNGHLSSLYFFTNANIVYYPDANFYGNDSFTYFAYVEDTNQFDELFDSSTGTVQIIVTPPLPTASSAFYSNYGDAESVALVGSDPDGLAVSYQIVSLPTNGTLNATSLPQITYTPNAGFYGLDSFTFDTYDVHGTSTVATVTFDVVEYDHFPTVNDIETNSFVGISITIPLSAIASDVLNDPLTLVSLPEVDGGTATFTSDAITFTGTNASSVPGGYYGDVYFVVSNSFETSTGVVSVFILNRKLAVGETNLQGDYSYINAEFIIPIDTLPDAVTFANSYGPALEWDILLPLNYPDPITPIYLTQSQGSTSNGDLSALDITGNIRIMPVQLNFAPPPSVSQNIPLLAASQLYAMRLFQVEPGARLCLQTCTLSGGVATDGGAIFNEGQLELSNVIFTADEAIAEGTNLGLGGAIFSENASIAMTNCIMTNNIADLGGELYQIGDGGAAMTTVSNCIMSGSGAALDFVSTNAHGGTSSITATLLSAEQPTAPWFGPLAASYTIEQNLSVEFSAAFDPAQYQFTVSPSAPWGDASMLQITGAGSQRKLALSQPETNNQAPQNILVSLSNGQLTYAENFSLAVDASHHNAPIVSNLTVDVVQSSYGYTGSASIPVLINDLNPDGPQSQLTLVSISRLKYGTGTVAIHGNNVEYTNTVFAFFDSFTYVVSNGYLSSTGTVFINLIYPFPSVYYSADSGYGTLRADLEAVGQNYYQGGWVVTLDPSIDSPIINVYTADDNTEGPSAFVIAENVTIDGSAVPGATIQLPTNASPMRFFHILPGASLTLSNITLAGGIAAPSVYGAGCGGAIYNEGSLDLENVTITGCQAIGDAPGLGGAIFNLGSVVLNGSALTNNTSGNGGGIYQLADDVTTSILMTNSTIINPASAYDLTSVATNNGTASVLAVGSVIQNPAAPWIGELDDTHVHGNSSIPFYVGPPTNTLQLTATTDNGNVVPPNNPAFSGSNGLRYLNLNAVSNGIVDVVVRAALGNLSFAREFTVSVLGNSNSIPVVPDYFATLFAGQILTLPVLTNAYDLGNSPLELVSVTCPIDGTAILTNGQLIYSNSGGTNSSDFFTYVVTNTFGGSSTGQVFLTILPAVETLTNANEYGPGSIRAAFDTIGSVQDNLTWSIAPAPSLAGKTITLTGYYPSSGEFYAFFITNHILIDGGAAPGFTIAISQNHNIAPDMRAFKVASGGLLELQNLTLIGGNSDNNGSGAGGFGGSIYSQGTLNISNVTFAGNNANGTGNTSGGGAICNDGGTARFLNCIFSNNSVTGTSPGAGGAILNRDGILLLASNLFVSNSAHQAADVFNLGDSDSSTTNLTRSGSATNLLGEVGMADLSLQNNHMITSPGTLDLVGAATNGGGSAIVSYQTNVMTQSTPSISAIADQLVPNAISVPFDFAFSSANPVLTAFSSDPNVIPNANLAIATNGNAGDLTITPSLRSGVSMITLQLTEGPLSYAEVFQVIATGSPFLTIQMSGSNTVLQFYGSPGTNYYIQEATPLLSSPWQDLPGTPLSVSVLGPINYTITNSAATSFYRTSAHP